MPAAEPVHRGRGHTDGGAGAGTAITWLLRDDGASLTWSGGRTAEGPFLRFRGDDVNRPDRERAKDILNDLTRFMSHENLKNISRTLISRVYREDIYDQAMGQILI